MCDCIEKLETTLTEQMVERNTGCEVIENVSLSPKFLYTTGYPLYFNAIGRIQNGKRTRKFDTHIIPTYCPFCGKEI